MDTKSRILEILISSAGASVSGADMARELGISRNAVCKAVAALKKEGWDIKSATNRGYTLTATDLLDPTEIEELLPHLPQVKVKYFESIDSTNDQARQMAAAGADDGTVVLAVTQSRGRGRKGREFYSPSGSGIYLSLVLRPKFSAEKSLLITVAAAVAVAKALDKTCGTDAKIKWVNDVYCRGKKVCGILTEAAMNVETGGLDWAVLGVGINVYEPKGGFAPEIRHIAAAAHVGDICPGLKNNVTAQFLSEFYELYGRIESADFMAEYRRRSNVIGTDITVWRGNEVFDARALDIDTNGGLVIALADGSTQVLQSGEITIRSKDTVGEEK